VLFLELKVLKAETIPQKSIYERLNGDVMRVHILLYRMSRNGVSVAQGRVIGLNSRRKISVSLCPTVSCYEDMGVLKIRFAGRIIVSVTLH
jgi:hypothetical protein